MSIILICCLSILVVCTPSFLFSQNEEDSTSNTVDALTDTTQTVFQTLHELEESQNASSKSQFSFVSSGTYTKSPTGAMWRSAVLPGWGQWYVESYWKAGAVMAGTGFLGYLLVQSQSDFSAADDLYQAALALEANSDALLVQREVFRDQRDDAILYFSLLYFVSIIDAYVGGHLYDFDVSEDWQMGFYTTPPNRFHGTQVGIYVQW